MVFVNRFIYNYNKIMMMAMVKMLKRNYCVGLSLISLQKITSYG